MTSTEVQAVRRAITQLCSLIDKPQGSAGIPRRSPVWRFVQEYLVAEASADLTCEEAWQFFLEIVKANELPPTRKALFLRQLPSLMESAFHVRKCHHIWRGGRRVRGFRGVGIRLDTCAPATPELEPEPTLLSAPTS
jgi:hypothetical protein